MPDKKGDKRESSEAEKPETGSDGEMPAAGPNEEKPEKGAKPKRKIQVKKKHVVVGSGAVLAAIVLGLILLSVFPAAKQVTDQPLTGIKAGRGEVIKGFDDALLGMEVGDKKTVTITPKDAYGEYDPKKTIAVPLVQEDNRILEIDRFVTVPRQDFLEIFSKEPIIGDVVTYSPFEFKVGMVTGQVTLENLLEVGDVVTLPSAEWKTAVVDVGEKIIELRQDPEEGQVIETQFGPAGVTATEDKIIITVEPELGKQIYTAAGIATVSDVNDTHLIVDTNHELAGKTLVFDIEIVSAEAPPVFGKPNVKLFVMSFCPYGTQAEEYAYPVQDLFGDMVDFDVHFVIYDPAQYAGMESTYCIENVCSMHGLPEVAEDMRQACINKYVPEKLWDYLMCVKQTCSLGDIGTCWEKCAEAKKIDIGKISECEGEEGVKLLQADKALNARYSVSGSPTIFINDDPYQGQRTAESMKNEVCKYFTEPPAECFETLDTTAATAAGSCS